MAIKLANPMGGGDEFWTLNEVFGAASYNGQKALREVLPPQLKVAVFGVEIDAVPPDSPRHLTVVPTMLGLDARPSTN